MKDGKEKKHILKIENLEHCFKVLKSKFNNVQVELLSASRLVEL